MELIVEGIAIKTTDEGFLLECTDWSETIASEIARKESIKLSAEHWDNIFFIRDYYQKYKHLPNARVFTKAIKKRFGEQIGNSRYLHKLFPLGPLKFSCKLAGLPKPPTCL